MANLLIAIIGIVFAAALALAGISYISPHAYVEHSQAILNTTQVDSLVTDYSNMSRSLGHRPTISDYQAVFPSSSENSKYAYSTVGGSTSVGSNAAMGTSLGQWSYMPNCASGAQDCFCLKVADSSSITFQAAKLSALHQMNASGSSRVEFSTSSCDDTSATTDPRHWGDSTPAAYYLTVRMTGGTNTQTSASTVYNVLATMDPAMPARLRV